MSNIISGSYLCDKVFEIFLKTKISIGGKLYLLVWQLTLLQESLFGSPG